MKFMQYYRIALKNQQGDYLEIFDHECETANEAVAAFLEYHAVENGELIEVTEIARGDARGEPSR
jgi:hypothetical protein